MKKLNVFLHNLLTGKLWLDENRRFIFQYDTEYMKNSNAMPLSLHLPFQNRVYGNDSSKSFFANLLPEGNIKEMIAKQKQISENNDFALLEAFGGECAGAITVLPESLSLKRRINYKKISSTELKNISRNYKDKPLLALHKEIRLSLAGIQNKLPVYIKDNQFYYSSESSPSTHIIKPDNPMFPDMIYNETFCMILAKTVGLSVPDVYIWEQDNEALLVIARYDRKSENNKIVRLHQEDFCQAMGYSVDQKYQAEGGPDLNQCFQLLNKFSKQPLVDKKSMINWTIFNFIIGNADAHAKNISILYKNNSAQLAPFYDLVSTLVYPDLVKKMAMKIGNEDRFDWIMKRHWERFAEGIDVKYSYFKKISNDFINKISKHLQQEHNKKVVKEIIKVIKNNINRLEL